MPRKPATPEPKPRPTILDDPDIKAMRVVSPAEAAAILRCGPTHLSELVRDGALRSYLDGTARRIFLESIFEYQRTQPIAPEPKPRKPKPKARPSRLSWELKPALAPPPPVKLKPRQRLKPWQSARRGRGR
jgi:excisionase family DNA binding protein